MKLPEHWSLSLQPQHEPQGHRTSLLVCLENDQLGKTWEMLMYGKVEWNELVEIVLEMIHRAEVPQ